MSRKTENSSFTCAVCGASVPEIHRGTIRDHCPTCLCSLHVDNKPGDRAATCKGVLRPAASDYSGKKGHIIIYKCDSCGIEKRNKLAPDDNMDAFLAIQSQQINHLRHF